jgi:hypothetical protein
MGVSDLVKKLLGYSAYNPGKGYGPDIDDPLVESIRENVGGNLALQPTTRTRWYLADLESAQFAADAGDMSIAAQLWRDMRRDAVISGLMSTLTSGLTALPKKFYGDEQSTAALQKRNGTRSVFDDMCPPDALSALAADGKALGVFVGELVPVPGRDFPVLIRQEPEFLRYRWVENRWYFNSVAGLLPITPGDGRWVLGTPGGRVSPWINGLWPALGRAHINKTHAFLHRSNYSAKLANPARAAIAPAGATEPQRVGFLTKLISWGVNSVFELPPGWDVKLIESKGEGIKVFQDEIDTCDREITIAIAGQLVTTDGGAGFQNSDIHRAIRSDIIKDTAEQLAYTINTQVLPYWLGTTWGVEAIDTGAIVEWDVRRAKENKDEAQGFQAIGQALQSLTEVLGAQGYELDMRELMTRYEIPIREAPVKPIEEDSVEAKRVLAYIRHEKGKWVVYSEGGKRLGEYSSKAEAEKRLRQIEYFKNRAALVVA